MDKPDTVVYRLQVSPFTRHGTGTPIVDKCVVIPNTPHAPSQLQERYEKLYDGFSVSVTKVELEDDTPPAPPAPPAPPPKSKSGAVTGYVLRLSTCPEEGPEVECLAKIQELLNKFQSERQTLRKCIQARLETKYAGLGTISDLRLSEDCTDATFDLRVSRGFLREVTDEEVLRTSPKTENV